MNIRQTKKVFDRSPHKQNVMFEQQSPRIPRIETPDQ